jgi:hypothetical protein
VQRALRGPYSPRDFSTSSAARRWNTLRSGEWCLPPTCSAVAMRPWRGLPKTSDIELIRRSSALSGANTACRQLLGAANNRIICRCDSLDQGVGRRSFRSKPDQRAPGRADYSTGVSASGGYRPWRIRPIDHLCRLTESYPLGRCAECAMTRTLNGALTVAAAVYLRQRDKALRL